MFFLRFLLAFGFSSMLFAASCDEAKEGLCIQAKEKSCGCPQLVPADYLVPNKLCLENPCGSDFQASFLYWKAVQDGMETYTLYMLTTQSAGAGFSQREEQYQVGLFDYSYKPAFKLAFDQILPYDDWDLKAEYTWYGHTFYDRLGSIFNTTDPAQSSSLQGNLMPRFILKMNNHYTYTLGTGFLSSKFWLKLNLTTLELGRSFYVGKYLALRPHFGLKADFIEEKVFQSFNIPQTDTVNTAPNDTKHVEGGVKQRASSWGLGLRSGVGADYQFFPSMKIFGKMAASLLYTHYNLLGKQKSTLNSTTSNDFQFQTTHLNRMVPGTVRPSLELAMGVSWGDYFFCRKTYGFLDLSYDFIAMWSQNMFSVFSLATPNGDFSSSAIQYKDLFLHGLTVTTGIAF